MKTAYLMVGVAMLALVSGPLAADMTLPYFEDFETIGLPGFAESWTLAHHGNSPILTGDDAHSGTVSITDPGANCGMQTLPFVDGPMVGDEASISLWWKKGDQGAGGEDDRVRIDCYDGGSYALTVVIWDGAVLNDQNTSQKAVEGLQVDTWYKLEVLFNRKPDNSGYDPDTTIRVFNADDTLFGSGVLTAGLGSRVVPDEISKFDVSFRGNMGIFIDDISIMEGTIIPEPATMSLLAIGAVALLRRRR